MTAPDLATAEPLLKADEAARILRVHVNTLANWRRKRTGLAWIDVEGEVRYHPDAVREYLAAKTRPVAAETAA